MLGGPARMLMQETSKPQNTLTTLGRFGKFFRPYWFVLVGVMFFMLVSTWTQIMGPQLIKEAVDCYLFPTGTAECSYGTGIPSDSEMYSGIGTIVVELLGLYLLGSVMSGAMFYSMNWVGQSSLREMRVQLFKHVNRLSIGFHNEHEAGDVMSRFTNDAQTIQQAFSFGLVQVMSGTLLIGWIMLTMLRENVPYALLSLSVVPFMLIATLYFSNQARKAFRIGRAEMGSVNANLQENISSVREVQAFSREDENISKFEQTNAANRDAMVKAAAYTSALRPVLEALGFVAIAIVVVVGGRSVLRNDPLLGTSVITLGTVIAFLQYVQRFNQPIQQIATLWTNIQSAIAGGERIFGLLDEVPNMTDKPDATAMPEIQGKVVFDDVTAEYKAGEPVLKGISFAADPGQMIAIVGHTGAGKTTIINLIPRFYDVTSGSVKIDDLDVRDVKRQSLRSQIGIVLQDTFLFSDTVVNNIRYGKPDATDEEVIAAAKLARADTFVERLPDGYQTVLGERGSGLSQGQRQLLAIARTILADPRILILDEATSSVDTRTERLIQEAFEQLLHERTSFVIAHRLSTIRNADLVLMMEQGEIIERGTHHELIEKQGAYYDLYMSQFQEEEVPASGD